MDPASEPPRVPFEAEYKSTNLLREARISEWLPPNVRATFAWKPGKLENPPATVGLKGKKNVLAASETTGETKQPAFYDRHFDRRLQLRRIQFLPTLIDDLLTNLDVLLDGMVDDGIVLPDDGVLPNEGALEWDEQAEDHYVVDKEEGVANYYYTYTARYCVRIASMLLLHPDPAVISWSGLLAWSTSVKNGAAAISDGSLHVKYNPYNPKDARARNLHKLWEIAREYNQDQFTLLENLGSTDNFPSRDIMTWEMKSLVVASEEFMTSLFSHHTSDAHQWFKWSVCRKKDTTCDAQHMPARNDVERPWRGTDMPNGMYWTLPATHLEPDSRDLDDGNASIPDNTPASQESSLSTASAASAPQLQHLLGEVSNVMKSLNQNRSAHRGHGTEEDPPGVYNNDFVLDEYAALHYDEDDLPLSSVGDGTLPDMTAGIDLALEAEDGRSTPVPRASGSRPSGATAHQPQASGSHLPASDPPAQPTAPVDPASEAKKGRQKQKRTITTSWLIQQVSGERISEPSFLHC